jgi:hypothetical protein
MGEIKEKGMRKEISIMEAIEAEGNGKSVYFVLRDYDKMIYPFSELDMYSYARYKGNYIFYIDIKKKTLSDKIENTKKGVCDSSNYYYEEDVKEALAEYIIFLKTDWRGEKDTMSKAKEIFGERLIE